MILSQLHDSLSTPLLKLVITEAPPEVNAFEFSSSNPNLEIRPIRLSCIVFESAALVSEICRRSIESINPTSTFHFPSS